MAISVRSHSASSHALSVLKTVSSIARRPAADISSMLSMTYWKPASCFISSFILMVLYIRE